MSTEHYPNVESMFPKRLQTARLSLEPIGTKDLAWFTALNRHLHVRRHLWDGRPIESAEARDIIVRSAEAFAREGHGLWVGRAVEAAVGYYGLWHFFEESQPQLLYVSDPRLTRRGYAREACRSIIAHAFGELGFPYLDAAVDAGNAPSLALARALGFTERRTESIGARPTILLRRERRPVARERAARHSTFLSGTMGRVVAVCAPPARSEKEPHDEHDSAVRTSSRRAGREDAESG